MLSTELLDRPLDPGGQPPGQGSRRRSHLPSDAKISGLFSLGKWFEGNGVTHRTELVYGTIPCSHGVTIGVEFASEIGTETCQRFTGAVGDFAIVRIPDGRAA